MSRAPAIFATLLFAAPVFACSITVTRPVQVLVRSAAIIAEAEAVDGPEHRFNVTKVWKGAPAREITLRGDVEPQSTCYGGRPAVGETYILFITCDRKVEREGFAQYTCTDPAEALHATPEVMRYLTAPKPLTRRELIAKLRGWSNGRIATEELRQWVTEQRAVAEVEDWSEREGTGESITLGVLQMLDVMLQGEVNGDAECVVRKARAKLVPELIEVLTARDVSEERLEALDEALLAIEDGCG